ncbi:DNA-binding protein [Paenibacillus macquariensis subsp. defensor]|nr:DNA-binding protein [Paenibacillus macquariensis subsp. defensor]
MKIMMTVNELSENIGVSTDSIYAMVRENQIPYIRVRRRILFHKEMIEKWLRREV